MGSDADTKVESREDSQDNHSIQPSEEIPPDNTVHPESPRSTKETVEPFDANRCDPVGGPDDGSCAARSESEEGPRQGKHDIIVELIGQISASLDADIILYYGLITRRGEREILSISRRDGRRQNVVLILATAGGDGNSAYRLARHLQDKYAKFVLLVTGWCKSAGTLVALGAQEIVMSDEGELGPLDVQVLKSDELARRGSGLTAAEALETLSDKSFSMFEQYLLELTKRSEGMISAKTAMNLAQQVTVGLFRALYEQVDPERLAEDERAMRIAEHYGQLLGKKTPNLKPGSIQRLVRSYPAHEFVIDRAEAQELFQVVREPSSQELGLVAAVRQLRKLGGLKVDQEVPAVLLLSESASGNPGNGEGMPSTNSHAVNQVGLVLGDEASSPDDNRG